jgi:outer membrane immunogenic protein
MTISLHAVRVAAALVLWLAVAVPAAAQNWTGAYISGHIGFSRIPEGSDNIVVFDRNLDGDFTDTITTATGANAFSPGFCAGAAASAQPTAGCAVDDSGIDAGGRGGYDWQMGALVFGVLGEFAFVDHVDSVSAFSTTPAFYTFTRELEWLGGVRARAGYGGARALVYGTGGLAWGGLDHSFATSNAVNTFVESEEDMAWGYQLGGGVEFKFGGRWTAGAEYLWTSLADEDRYTVRAQGPAPATNPFILGNASGSDLRRADSLNLGAIRVTMGYRF